MFSSILIEVFRLAPQFQHHGKESLPHIYDSVLSSQPAPQFIFHHSLHLFSVLPGSKLVACSPALCLTLRFSLFSGFWSPSLSAHDVVYKKWSSSHIVSIFQTRSQCYQLWWMPMGPRWGTQSLCFSVTSAGELLNLNLWAAQFFTIGLSSQYCWLSTQHPIFLSPSQQNPIVQITTLFSLSENLTNQPICQSACDSGQWVGAVSVCPIRLTETNYTPNSRKRLYSFSSAGHKQWSKQLLLPTIIWPLPGESPLGWHTPRTTEESAEEAPGPWRYQWAPSTWRCSRAHHLSPMCASSVRYYIFLLFKPVWILYPKTLFPHVKQNVL